MDSPTCALAVLQRSQQRAYLLDADLGALPAELPLPLRPRSLAVLCLHAAPSILPDGGEIVPSLGLGVQCGLSRLPSMTRASHILIRRPASAALYASPRCI